MSSSRLLPKYKENIGNFSTGTANHHYSSFSFQTKHYIYILLMFCNILCSLYIFFKDLDSNLVGKFCKYYLSPVILISCDSLPPHLHAIIFYPMPSRTVLIKL